MQCNVLEYLEETVNRFPTKIAVEDKAGVLTFAELNESAMVIAGKLVSEVTCTNRPIAVFLPTKTADSLVAFVAALYSGNAYVPLDITSPPSRIKRIIDNLEPAGIVTSEKYLDQLSACGVRKNEIILMDDGDSVLCNEARQEIKSRTERIIDTDPAYIIYTSGSTGTPKGVVIPHRGIIDYIDWAKDCYSVDEKTIIGNQAPFYFDNSTLDIFLCLATGATLVLIPAELFMFPAKLLQFMVEREISFIFWVPSVLINVANFDVLQGTELPALDKILFAGEVMPVKHLGYWMDHFPHALFSNLYGPTEITVDCTYFIVNRRFEDQDSLPIGFPCKNSDVLILDGDEEVSGKGKKGELCVRGSSLALGYWNNPEKTDRAFTQNPLNPHFPERIYRTGDVVHINERGEIIFDGRIDFQIKHMGYRIELGEIETAVLALSDINNACAVYDDLNSNIVLFYEAEKTISPAEFRRGLMGSLPKYMLPSNYQKLDVLPKNQNGKIDRQQLLSKIGV